MSSVTRRAAAFGLFAAVVLAGCTLSESLGVYAQTSSDGAQASTGGASTGGVSTDATSTGTGTGAGESAGVTSASETTSTGADASAGATGTSVATTGAGGSGATTGGGLGRCTPAPEDDECEQCLKQECCDALTGCEQVPDCLCLQTCLLNLSFPECSEWCPPGPAFTYLAACTATQCGAECQP